ncbi:MAG: chromate resistance protein [Halobacteriales archaeon]|nr:chromate resistance protein [Halobacteriales archaeon]
MHWVTRERPHVDRTATAWLVQRFIDPKATFSFIASGDEVPAGATPFDLPGVKYGHQGTLCTFEVVLREYGLKDPALARVAALVCDLDFRVGKHPDAPGVDAILIGLLLAEKDDANVLAKAASVWDALYAHYSKGEGRGR